MADASLWWGGDLSLSATGDLLTVDDEVRGEQRVVRRLCTNPAEYLFHLDYGAGLPRYVGQPTPRLQIEALVRVQMRKEEAVMQSPEPAVTSRQDGLGTLSMHIRYTDRPTQSPRSLSFDVTE